MKWLLTNDDGIESEGLLHAARWAQKQGEVLIVAPKRQQSASSHAIEIHAPFEVKKVDYPLDVPAYAVDSTPADCVRVALALLQFEPDLILSGINRGFNLGMDIVYSATVGAIFEGATSGVPGLALSTSVATFSAAQAYLNTVWNYIQERKLYTYGQLFNVNIPENVRGIRLTKQAGPHFRDRFIANGEDTFMADGYSVYKGTADLTLDLDAVMNDYISITPLTISRTDMQAYLQCKDSE